MFRNRKVCYGQALTETVGWHGDYRTFVSEDNPWLTRGGRGEHAAQAGIFAIGHTGGHAGPNHSFRLVLSAE